MYYESTRDKNHHKSSSQAILQGLSPDGGLYVPSQLVPLNMSLREFTTQSPYYIFTEILAYLLPDLSKELVAKAVKEGYSGKFESEDLTPTVPVGNAFVVELFRGPTNAFKDMALLLLPHLVSISQEVEGETEETIILTATSGDTGKAALAGFANMPNTKIIVFYPEDGVSQLQRAQMVTQEGNNVCVCAVKGNFDDAQRGVKEIFNTVTLPTQKLSSANSINIGRLAPQVGYYFKTYGDLLRQGVIEEGDLVDFVVPTGNFGNILAGYLAKQLGLPVGTLVCASNSNDVLTEFLETGRYNRRREFLKTNSPSMDILVSSNLERLLWFLTEQDSEAVAGYMEELSTKGEYTISKELLTKLQSEFACGKCSDEEAEEVIARIWKEEQYLLDPHTAVAWKVYEDYQGETSHPVVILSTASPYKFPSAMLEALGETVPEDGFDAMTKLSNATGIPIPESLSALQTKPVLHTDVIAPEDMAEYVKGKAGESQWGR